MGIWLRRLVALALVVAVIVTAVVWRRSRTTVAPVAHAVAPAAPVRPATAASSHTRANLDRLAREIPPENISPIAQALGDPHGTIQHDLQLLNEVFGAWETNFPHTGNPVGENDEITAALAGDNPLHFAFIAPNHPAINAQGELCDRWGTPFRFHQRSGTQMEIRSAGPDRRFNTADDVEFAPWGKPE